MEARMEAMELKLQLQQHHEVVLRRDIHAACRGATARLQAWVRRWQAQREVSRLEAIPVIKAAVMGWWVREWSHYPTKAQREVEALEARTAAVAAAMTQMQVA